MYFYIYIYIYTKLFTDQYTDMAAGEIKKRPIITGHRPLFVAQELNLSLESLVSFLLILFANFRNTILFRSHTGRPQILLHDSNLVL